MTYSNLCFSVQQWPAKDKSHSTSLPWARGGHMGCNMPKVPGLLYCHSASKTTKEAYTSGRTEVSEVSLEEAMPPGKLKSHVGRPRLLPLHRRLLLSGLAEYFKAQDGPPSSEHQFYCPGGALEDDPSRGVHSSGEHPCPNWQLFLCSKKSST